jgi:hypothetical protein
VTSSDRYAAAAKAAAEAQKQKGGKRQRRKRKRVPDPSPNGTPRRPDAEAGGAINAARPSITITTEEHEVNAAAVAALVRDEEI